MCMLCYFEYRSATWKSPLTPKSWKLAIRIQNGSATLLYDNGFEKPVNFCYQDGKIILGGSGLLITVITPLQTMGRGDPNGVRILEVIKDRLESNPVKFENFKAKELTSMFTNKKKNPEAKIELHRYDNCTGIPTRQLY